MRATGELKRQAASPIEPAAMGPDKKNRQAAPLAMLVITVGDDLQPGAQTIHRAMGAANKESLVLRIDEDQSKSGDEQVMALRKSITDLHAAGRIGANTQVVIDLHGSQEETFFSLGTEDSKVNLDAANFVDFLLANGNPKIHILSCQSGHLREKLNQRAGTCFLHGGKKALLSDQGTELMEDFCRFLGLQKEAPSDDQLFAFFETCAGENFAMTGHGKLAVHDTTDFEKYKGLPPGPDGSVAMEGLDQKKKERVFLSKLSHGSNETMQAVLDQFGNGLLIRCADWSPAFLAARSKNQPSEKLRALGARGMNIDAMDAAGLSGLQIACEESATQVAERLLEAGANPDLLFPGGTTALALAIKTGNAALAELLLDYDANPNCPGPAGISLLEFAISLKQFDIALLLLDHFAHADVIARAGKNLLEEAFKSDHPPLMQALLKNGANPNQPTKAGGSLAQLAIDKDEPEILCLLLEFGAKRVDLRQDGGRLLQLMINEKEHLTLGSLLKFGADPTGLTAEGESLIQFAIRKNNLPALCLLLRAMADQTPVKLSPKDWKQIFTLIASQSDKSGALDTVLEPMLKKCIPADKLNSLCTVAFECGARNVVAVLVSLGANDPALQQLQREAIEAAIQRRDLASLKLALKGGIVPNLKLSDGVAAFESLIWWSEVKMAEMLLAAGARGEPKLGPKAARASDHLLANAINKPDLTRVDLLLRYRADASTVGLVMGRAPSLLHLAVLEIVAGHADIALLSLLANAGAHVLEGAGTKHNLVQLARQLKSPEIARELIRLGASGRALDDTKDKKVRGVLKPTKAETSLRPADS